jgi:putative membrane protein
MVLIVYLLLSWLANIVSLLVVDWIFDSVTIGRWWPIILGAAILGIANTIVKPILTLLTLPLVIVTLGLSYFAINVLMLALAEWIAPDFSIDGFWTYIGATIVVSIVSWAMHAIFGMFEGSKNAQLAS